DPESGNPESGVAESGPSRPSSAAAAAASRGAGGDGQRGTAGGADLVGCGDCAADASFAPDERRSSATGGAAAQLTTGAAVLAAGPRSVCSAKPASVRLTSAMYIVFRASSFLARRATQIKLLFATFYPACASSAATGSSAGQFQPFANQCLLQCYRLFRASAVRTRAPTK
ncbi:unnamed protein product, partial [Ixodes pacificus]